MPDLPSFESPPLTEVVIAARLKRANRYSLLTLGDLARQLAKAGFSKIEERPGYEAPAESFGPASEQSGLSLELLSGPPPIRYWFSNEAGDELLQIQSNWFAANWRKVAPAGEYGRWESRWDAFQRWITVFAGVVSDGKLDFDQVEVTYVNHIEPEEVWSHHGDAALVFTPLALPQSGFLVVCRQNSGVVCEGSGVPRKARRRRHTRRYVEEGQRREGCRWPAEHGAIISATHH